MEFPLGPSPSNVPDDWSTAESEDYTALIFDAYENDDFWLPPSVDHACVVHTDCSHSQWKDTLETSRFIEHPSHVTNIHGHRSEHVAGRVPPLEQHAEWTASTMPATSNTLWRNTPGPSESEWPNNWNRMLPPGPPNQVLVNCTGTYDLQGLSNGPVHHPFVPCPDQVTYPSAQGMLKDDNEPIAVHGMSNETFVPPVSQAPSQDYSVKVARRARKKSSKGRKCKASRDSPVPSLTAYNFYFRVERQRLISNASTDNGAVGANNGGPHPFAWIVTRSREFQDSVLLDQWGRDPQAKRKHTKTHGQISFTSLTCKISKSWNVLPTVVKDVFHEIAARDYNRCSAERSKLLSLQVVEGKDNH